MPFALQMQRRPQVSSGQHYFPYMNSFPEVLVYAHAFPQEPEMKCQSKVATCCVSIAASSHEADPCKNLFGKAKCFPGGTQFAFAGVFGNSICSAGESNHTSSHPPTMAIKAKATMGA